MNVYGIFGLEHFINIKRGQILYKTSSRVKKRTQGNRFCAIYIDV